ncbi:MAG: hypothetical protein H0W64_09170 [Gammaproteobacteria bacterium]|nr:hypothetical protein [Gammaproteobacteria bacterium]
MLPDELLHLYQWKLYLQAEKRGYGYGPSDLKQAYNIIIAAGFLKDQCATYILNHNQINEFVHAVLLANHLKISPHLMPLTIHRLSMMPNPVEITSMTSFLEYQNCSNILDQSMTTDEINRLSRHYQTMTHPKIKHLMNQIFQKRCKEVATFHDDFDQIMSVCEAGLKDTITPLECMGEIILKEQKRAVESKTAEDIQLIKSQLQEADRSYRQITLKRFLLFEQGVPQQKALKKGELLERDFSVKREKESYKHQLPSLQFRR